MRFLRPRRRPPAATGGREAAAAAEQEIELSRRREKAIRAKVVTPLTEAAERNQFAEMLRHSLIGDGK